MMPSKHWRRQRASVGGRRGRLVFFIVVEWRGVDGGVRGPSDALSLLLLLVVLALRTGGRRRCLVAAAAAASAAS